MRRLIVCSDGTLSSLTKKKLTNVAKLASALLPEAPDGTTQLVYYDAGVGTGDILDRATGGLFGSGLYENVKDAYQFLMNNYIEGDEIYLFGYSRGAFTVRSLGGLVRKCGLLHKKNVGLVASAYEIYQRGRKGGGRQGVYSEDWPESDDAPEFRAANSREVSIKFIGVWDTVGSLGLQIARNLRLAQFSKNEFHDLRLSKTVQYGYHALAIDERRLNFRPTLWERQPDAPKTQVLEQVWFAGCHGDVGGGAKGVGLSSITFSWMKAKAEAAGLAFDEAAIVGLKFEPDGLSGIDESWAWRFPWCFIPPWSRKIEETPLGCESVGAPAIDRYRSKTMRYRPRNLVSYLQRHDLF